MDDSLKFRFVTRTLSEDYRVYADGGARLLSDRSEFEPLRQRGGIVPEEGPCVVLFEEPAGSGLSAEGGIFLVASGMRRPSRDVAGRPIRFSFCQIFEPRRKGRERAWSAFERLTTDWEEAEREAGSLIREIPRGEQGALLGEDVRFDQESFTRWLQRERPQRTGLRSAAFQVCRGGETFPAKQGEGYLYPLWPAAGCLLRWTFQSGDVKCQRMESGAPVPAEEPVVYHPHPDIQPRKRRWLIPTAVAVLLLCVGGVLKWNQVQRDREARLAEERAAEERAVAQAAETIHALLENISTRIESEDQAANALEAGLEDIGELSRIAAERKSAADEARRKAQTLIAAAEFLPTSGDVGAALSAIIGAAREESEGASEEARRARERLSGAEDRAQSLRRAREKLRAARALSEKIRDCEAQARSAVSRTEAEDAATQAEKAAREAETLLGRP
ncbi:MAG: hypothetical protein IJU98_05905 [Synergistaceae bacterium]|nr:hypothetical protein [Synergistaceae bacterium]